MKCKDCDLEVERGLFAQVEHFSKCKGNVSVYNGKITAKDIEDFCNSLNEPPREYRGSTICGKLWVSVERHIIAACDDPTCERCTAFNNMLREENKNK
jgi:hypothetical protein